MPILRPFRALRYGVPGSDLTRLLCPPYDIISPAEQAALLARDPHNAVRIELPAQVGAADAASWRSAARAVAEWRTDRVLVKDREPTLTLHRMTWDGATGERASCTGAFVRLRLEAFGPGSGVRPHERTMSGPKEDRFGLLRATGLNSSPIVLLADAQDGAPAAAMSRLVAGPPGAHATTDDGVSHQVWVRVVDADDDDAAKLIRLLAAGPLTIADGHHRYETALRYREERGQNRACESDPAWDYVLALVYPVDLAPPVLPTHRVVRDGPAGDELLAVLSGSFDVEMLPDARTLADRMGMAPVVVDGRTGSGRTGSGRIGLLSGGRAAILTARPGAFEAAFDPGLSEASRGLDVNLLAATLERLLGVDAPALAAGGRLTYVKQAADALSMVESGTSASAFLLDPMPPSAVMSVADAGEVMPQKSTYFDPKAPTGLLFSPLEW